MRNKSYKRNNNLVLGLLGIFLFLLVISVLYLTIFLSDTIQFMGFQFLMPFVILTGFFIFLVAAMLLALALFKVFSGFR